MAAETEGTKNLTPPARTYDYQYPSEYGPAPQPRYDGPEPIPVCSPTAAERFRVTAGRCALVDGTRVGDFTRAWTQATCGEAGHCQLTGHTADNVEAILAMPPSDNRYTDAEAA